MREKGGHAEGSANVQAAKLLDGKTFPEVPKLIKELRQARERRYGVTLLNQLKRFEDLSIAAEEAGQFSAAINAEKIRSPAMYFYLTVEKRSMIHETRYPSQMTCAPATLRLRMYGKARCDLRLRPAPAGLRCDEAWRPRRKKTRTAIRGPCSSRD